MIVALLSIVCRYFLIFGLLYYSWEADPPLPFEPLPFEELSSEDLTFKELDQDKFVVQFDDLDPNSEGESLLEPPVLPDKKSDDYKLKLYEDQVHLTNALKTFKIAKTTHGMTKDILKEIGDKTFKGVNVKCGLLSSGCGIGNLSACVWGAVCAVLLPVLILSLSFGYYSVLVAYHLTNITYESMAITKNSYDKQTHKNQYKSDKWMSSSLISMNNNMYVEYIKLNDNIFQQNRILNDHIFQQNYILNHNINAQHTTIKNIIDGQHNTILTNMNNQHTTINTNMINQHNEMRATLQQRHLDMTNEINTYSKCATNHILYETTEAIATAHGPGVTNDTPSPTPACIEVLNLPSSSRRHLAEGKEEEGVNEVGLTLSEGYKTTSDIYNEVDIVEENEEEIMAWARNIKETLDNISEKLDIDTAVPDPMNDSKSKKSKKAKQAKPEPEESDGGDLFTRNLLGVKEAVNVKFDMMESKVESIETKVKSMEGKIESIECQGNSIEGKVVYFWLSCKSMSRAFQRSPTH